MPASRHDMRVLVAALCVLGCRDLDRFDTGGQRAYCGKMSGEPFSAGFTPSGSSAAIGARLQLDIDHLTSLPGVLTTDDGAFGLCTPSPLFDGAALRAIPEVYHDALSTLEFGNGRDYNFFAWVDSTCKGTLVAVVSLMQNDSVELRLLRPASAAASDAGVSERPGFGVFSLKRQSSGCGF